MKNSITLTWREIFDLIVDEHNIPIEGMKHDIKVHRVKSGELDEPGIEIEWKNDDGLPQT